MTSPYVTCPPCIGQGWLTGTGISSWLLCKRCDGIGRVWAAGAPLYDCKITLGTRQPGEIVTLGNGDRGRLLWHTPRGKDPKRPPEVTYIGLIDDFLGEDHNPTAYPSCMGVRSVGVPRATGDDHYGDRAPDDNDPMQSHRGPLL